ncbi:MAG TPA: hypothetical protein VM096_15930 [Vicinamibacterales bacterium]|nr:hypothetical protein [Vicinamibacterales bacterium]
MSGVDPLAIAVRVSHILDALAVRHTIGGSIAASFAGEPRSTIDIDFVAALSHEVIAPLSAALSPEFYVSEEALHRAVDVLGSANLIHQDSQIKVDLFVAGGTPLDEQQLARRQRVEIRPGEVIHIHPPEDILLQKLRWFRNGGEVSDRQWRDVLGIVRTQGERLDQTYLAANAPVLNVAELLDRALRDGGVA